MQNSWLQLINPIIGLISIIIGFISIVINLFQISLRWKQKQQSIRTAENEILHAIRSVFYQGKILQKSTIKVLIKDAAENFNLREEKLKNVNEFFDKIIAEIQKNPAISEQEEKNRLIGLIQAEKSLNAHEKEKVTAQKKLDKKVDISVPPLPKTSTTKKAIIFYDDFESTNGWKKEGNGIVSVSDIKCHSGNKSLKKSKYPDPNGGYKELKEIINLDQVQRLCMSGWIYRVKSSPAALGDRLSLEDNNGCGYGFCLSHQNNEIWIERRENGTASVASLKMKAPLLMDQWQRFEFIIAHGGKMELIIFDEIGGISKRVNSYIDQKYSIFQRIAVRGGYPYYVDDLKVEVLK